MGPGSFWVVLVLAPAPLDAQRQASLGAGTGIVRFPGGSSFGAVTIAPAAQLTTTWTYVAAAGSLSLLERGVWAAQGVADLWTSLTHNPSGIRPAISTTMSTSTRSDGGVAAGAGALLLEAVGDHFALGAGGVTGVIQEERGVGALRIRGRTWWPLTTWPTRFSLTTEATRFSGAWYTDVVGGVMFDGTRTVASVWLSGRFSSTYGSTGAASASLQYFLTPTLALEASGGNYLRDPFQGLPRAGFIAAAVRVFAARRAAMRGPADPRPVLEPLVAAHRGADTVVVRFRMPAARSVAIAGNWNAWTPQRLQGLGDDIWEAALRLPAGTYYFNLVVDGRTWVVPGGVATVSDGMGGQVAVLNVM